MENNRQKTYIAIDLKSFYASVECAERKFDPLTTNLVVADESRTEKTICLAVSPSLKAYGIPGRPRLFEVVRKVKEANRKRLLDGIRTGQIRRDETGRYAFTSSSFDANVLAGNPDFEVGYFVAPPRMKLYEEYSTRIFSIYMKFISPEDIHVYSIDEVFMDVTGYLKTYNMTAHELAMAMIREVLHETGITATAGIGTNMYLAKVAMDIVAKHVKPDKDGVRIAELDEQSYREKLWCHQPLTDFWRVGRGLTRRLEKLGCHTMGDIARMSETHEDLLYREMGINAQLLIDHAWGWEPTEIKTIKSYKPESNSLSSGQVLPEPYNAADGKLIVREMTELLVLDLVRKNLVTKQVTLTLNYDRESLTVLRQGKSAEDTVYGVAKTGKPYRGEVGIDYYGRVCPKHAHGTGNLDRWTSSTKAIMETMMELYDRIMDPDLLIRRLNVVACNLIEEKDIPAEGPVQLDLFTDYGALEQQEAERKAAEEKEKKLQKATLVMQERFGKNAVLKGMNLQKKGTTRARNEQVGGHRAGDPQCGKSRRTCAQPKQASSPVGSRDD